MIRIVVECTDAGLAANVGGPVHRYFKFVDLESAELETILAEKPTFGANRVIGAEIITSGTKP